MRKIVYSAITTFVTAALITAGGGVQATESVSPEKSAAVDIERVLAARSDDPMLPSLGVVDPAQSDTADGPEVISDHHVSMTLPSDGPTAVSEYSIGDLKVFANAGHGYSTAIKEKGGGSYQALVRIESASAPTEYRFPVDISGGGRLVLQEDGSVLVVDDDGRTAGTFISPWAVDANGQPVPTSYAIDGATLIQRIAITGDTAFPVTADPFWIPALLVVGRLTLLASRQAASSGVTWGAIRHAVLNGHKTVINGGRSVVFSWGHGHNRVHVFVNPRSGRLYSVKKGHIG